MKNSNLFFTALPTLLGVLAGLVSLLLGAWLYAAGIDKFTQVQYKTEFSELNYWGAPGAFLWILGTGIIGYALLRKPSFTEEELYGRKKGGSEKGGPKPPPDPGGIPSNPFFKVQEAESEVDLSDRTEVLLAIKRTHAQMVQETIANAGLGDVVRHMSDTEFVEDNEEQRTFDQSSSRNLSQG